MKKVRLVIWLIIAVMIMTCFVACDNHGNPTGGNPTGGEHEHIGEWVVVTEPSCTEEGLKQQTCSICGTVSSEKIDELGHDFNGETTIIKPATCTEAGEKEVKCTRCDEKKILPIPTTGHDMVEKVVKEATCTEAGTKELKCSVCGHGETTTIPKLGHDFSGETTIIKPSTCKTQGEKEVKCTRCDEKEILPLPLAGHTMVDKVTKEATCTEAGTKESKCSVCGHSETETIPALGHDFANGASDASCEVGGSVGNFCNRCQKYIEGSAYALGHDYSGGYVVEKEQTCTETGLEVLYCARPGCHKELHRRLIQPTGHDWEKTSEENSDKECGGKVTHYVCKNEGCGAKKDELSGGSHVFGGTVTVSQATCTHGAYRSQTCTICGLTDTRYYASLSHSMFGGKYVMGAEATTTSDGYKYIECDTCGAEMPNTRVILPKYTIGEEHEFAVELERIGSLKFYGEANVEVYDGDELVTSGKTSSQKITFNLPAKDYTLKITSLPRGYDAQPSYMLRPGVMSTVCALSSHYEGGAKPSGYKYSVGDALYDLEFTSYEGEKYSVKELLKQYKAIFFDFYFTTCGYCNEEFPRLLAAKEKYEGDVLVVFVNGHGESDEAVKAHAKAKGIKGIIVKKFLMDDFPDKGGSWGFPTLVVVDCTGVIAERNRGALYGNIFETMMEKYIEFANLSGWKKDETPTENAQNSIVKQVALLPSRRKINE